MARAIIDGLDMEAFMEDNRPVEFDFSKPLSMRQWDEEMSIIENFYGVKYWAKYRYRDSHIMQVGFAIVTIELVERLKELLANSKTVEVGAGSCFLTNQLREAGVFIQPVDKQPDKYRKEWKNSANGVWIMDGAEFIKEHQDYDNVIMSWPCYQSPFAYEVALAMRVGMTLYYCGEGAGGCTGDDKFHAYLGEAFVRCDKPSDYLNEVHPQFYYIHDHWSVYKKVREAGLCLTHTA